MPKQFWTVTLIYSSGRFWRECTAGAENHKYRYKHTPESIRWLSHVRMGHRRVRNLTHTDSSSVLITLPLIILHISHLTIRNNTWHVPNSHYIKRFSCSKIIIKNKMLHYSNGEWRINVFSFKTLCAKQIVSTVNILYSKKLTVISSVPLR